jgi:hypothetical protein
VIRRLRMLNYNVGSDWGIILAGTKVAVSILAVSH